jgi:nitrogen regulatory protein PII
MDAMENAQKIVIITEKVITREVTQLIEECGATGYTTSPAGGKGSRGVRSTDRDVLSDTFANIKIEIIVNDLAMAEDIALKVREEFFQNYSGIIFVEDVKIIRAEKF